MQLGRIRAAIALAVVVILVAGVAGCAESKRGKGSTQSRLIFGTASRPVSFDPIFATDDETLRVDRQLFETLITYKPGTAELTPGLATSWTSTEDGKQWTFKLRKGVEFHDGSRFNAEAVCYNFDRWYNLTGLAAQSQAGSWSEVFGGFKVNASKDFGTSIYRGCEAKDPDTVVIKLNAFSGRFPAAFALTSFSISSPTALRKYHADDVTEVDGKVKLPEYATATPVGTGPYRLLQVDEKTGSVTLERFTAYHGGEAKLKTLVFKVIPDEAERKKALRAGSIQGYDMPSPADYQGLINDGFNLQFRPAFDVLYLGINQDGNKKLADIRVRKAIAYALDREKLVKTMLPAHASVATQFLPPGLDGYAKDITTYEYDPAKAKELLKEADAENLTLRFHYPTGPTPPYLADPKAMYELIAEQLAQVGIKVEPEPALWSKDYLSEVTKSQAHDLHLLGRSADYSYVGDFVGRLFGQPSAEFGDGHLKNMFAAIHRADSASYVITRDAAWQNVNRNLMNEWLPAIPLAYTPSAMVLTKNVKGLPSSPLGQEQFATAYFD